jgi:condensation enzyme
MSQRSHPADRLQNQFPLSCTQELFCAEEANFGPRFIVAAGWRIAGQIDIAALHGALDAVVARHELLRTIVVRDAHPPYQQVFPPCSVPLEIRDLPPATGLSADVRAEKLLIEAELSSVDVAELPLLRAILGRLGERDSVLILVAHHSASDGWSMQVIMRDLAASYAARVDRRPVQLPTVRQYREYAVWQQAAVAGPETGRSRKYWRDKLRGARIFAMPADHAVPREHIQPYSAHNFTIDAEVMAGLSNFARAMRSSPFMVLLAAFNMLANQITGTTDPVIYTLTTGRNEPQFQDTVGLFLNFLPLRTQVAGCTSFREVMARTRATCLEAYQHEIPIEHIVGEAPDLMQTLTDSRACETIFGVFQPQFDSMARQIADGSQEILKRELPEVSSDMGSGLSWNMELQSMGGLTGCVQFNVEDIAETKMTDWVREYRRILSTAVRDPDRTWAEF